jgi:hypothetical protein
MSKLPVSSAARVIGMARSTLRGIIARGDVHLEQGNLIDTAELERAGYTLKPDVLANEEAQLLHGRRRVQASPIAGPQSTVALDQVTALFREQLAGLREELAQAHARQLHMLRILEQLSRQIVSGDRPGRASAVGLLPRPQVRKSIMILLSKSHQGLTRKQIEMQLNSPNLRNVLQGMCRAGLLTRPESGVFTIAPKHRVAETGQG